MILLSILKWIGIVLLAILLLLLFLLCIVLFVPIRYRADAVLKDAEEDKKQPIVTAAIRWLFGILRVDFRYENSVNLKVKVLFFTLYPKRESSAEKEQTSPAADASDAAIETAAQIPADNLEENLSEEMSDDESQDVSSDNESAIDEFSASEDAAANSTAEAEVQAEKKSIPERLQDLLDLAAERIETFLTSTEDRIETIFDFIEQSVDKAADAADSASDKLEQALNLVQDEGNQQVVKKVIRAIGRLLKHLCPTRFRVHMRAGFEDPSTTGTMASAAAILYPIFGEAVELEPVFDDTVTEGDLHLRGRIRLAVFLWEVLKLICDRNVIRLYRQFRKARRKA